MPSPSRQHAVTLTFDLWRPESNHVINRGRWIFPARFIEIARAVHEISYGNKICPDGVVWIMGFYSHLSEDQRAEEILEAIFRHVLSWFLGLLYQGLGTLDDGRCSLLGALQAAAGWFHGRFLWLGAPRRSPGLGQRSHGWTGATTTCNRRRSLGLSGPGCAALHRRRPCLDGDTGWLRQPAQ